MSEHVFTRRDLLRLAGAAGAAARQVPARAQNTPRTREPLQALTVIEADLLDAIAARLIPSDTNGPGATEAMAVRYIDRALAGALKEQREPYRVGLAALERYARSSRGKSFLQLSPTEQDSVLIDVETGAATGANAGFQGSSGLFFALVRGHVWQGTFGDPFYGGNANFVGWDLLGYPGVRTYVGPAEQRLDSPATPVRASAYDNAMFTKAQAGARVRREGRDAD